MNISVIIPCHNSGAWIARTLKSVAAQTYPPHEIIVVDDASSDDSVERIRESGVDVRLIRVDCRNAAAARNHGIGQARGDWIALQDSQDIWYPDHLAKAAELCRDGDVVAYLATMDQLQPSGAIKPMEPPEAKVEDARRIQGEEYFLSGIDFIHPAVLYRMERVREVGLYDAEFVRRHDIELWLRVVYGQCFAYRAESIGAFHVGVPWGLSQNAVPCNLYLLRALIRHARAYRGKGIEPRIRHVAQCLVSSACTDMDNRVRVQEFADEAWPHLSLKWRLLLAPARRRPELLQFVFRTWRRLRSHGRSGTVLPAAADSV